MKLCFGTYANVLMLCSTTSIEKKKLVTTLLRSVEPNCDELPSNVVTGLLQCSTNLPNGRSDKYGNIKLSAQNVDEAKVSEYFREKIVVPLLEYNKRKLAVLALLNIIDLDESIDKDVTVDFVNKKTKKALMIQNIFVLSRFLAGVFLYVTQVENRVGKEEVAKVTSEYLNSFKEIQNTISFVVPQMEDEVIENLSETFIDYMTFARKKYENVKTLLYKDIPQPFYSFYVPNHAEQTIGRGITAELDYVNAEVLLKISNFLIIEGTGGLGKSLMLRHLLLNTIDDFQKIRHIPIYLTLKDFSDSTGSIEDFVFSKVTDLNRVISRQDFDTVLNKGQFLLLFDGLDEIEGIHSIRFEREIEAFADRYSENCFVLSSRPISSFVSFNRFSKIKLKPFSKEQALEFVERSSFRPDQPEIQQKFRNALSKNLYETHKSFAQNPLLLTIMFLTFENFSEVPMKMHIFYREAFLALSITHDSSKGAYKRSFKTGLNVDEVSALFEEICCHSYKEEMYDFTETKFADYFEKLRKPDKAINVRDFMIDLCDNLCLMYYESGKYHFVHRSFQEYFAAVFMSRQTDTIIGRLGNFFEKRQPREFTNAAFPMLYDIIPDKIEQFVIIPYLEGLLKRCFGEEGYWAFLEEMYPTIYYSIGNVYDQVVNEPQSYLYSFILNHIDAKTGHSIILEDLPFYEGLVVEEISKEKAQMQYLNLLNWKEDRDEWKTKNICSNYDFVENKNSEIVGYKLQADIKCIRKDTQMYSELLNMLSDDDFIFMQQFRTVQKYMDKLVEKMSHRNNELDDLFE